MPTYEHIAHNDRPTTDRANYDGKLRMVPTLPITQLQYAETNCAPSRATEEAMVSCRLIHLARRFARRHSRAALDRRQVNSKTCVTNRRT